MTPEPDLPAFRDFIYRNYAATHQVYGNAGRAHGAGRGAQLRGLLRQRLPANRDAAILDLGCGDGALLREAGRLGYQNLAGVDLSEGLLAIAAAATTATLHLADGLGFLKAAAPGRFDVITAFDVLEHLTRPELLQWAREIFRVLAPGGLLLAHLPNGASPFGGRIRWGDITHELAFTPHSLQQILRPLGFTTFAAWEDAPAVHGPRSAARYTLWKLLRLLAVAWLTAETGVFRGHILTINFCFAACKAGKA